MALNTRDLGRLFFLTLPQPERIRAGTRLFHFAPTWEMSFPYRQCPRTLIIRPNLVFRSGLVVGWWRDTGFRTVEEQESDMGMIPKLDLLHNPEVTETDRDAVRKHIADYGLEPEEEMELMQTLDLM